MFQTYKQAYNPTINPFLSGSIVKNIKDSLEENVDDAKRGEVFRLYSVGASRNMRYNHLTDYNRIERFKNVQMILARSKCDKNAEYDDDDDDDAKDLYNYMKTGLYILSLSSFAYYFYSKRKSI
jgi:hypothetical protein